MAETQHRSTLVLGIGNVLWADEGFGVRAAELFHARFAERDDLTIMDGGTRGMALLPFIQDCDTLLIFDAVDFDLPPGTLHVLEGADVPNFLGAKKMSLHQTGFSDVLAMAEFSGECPSRIVLIGVQPELLEDYGGGLTATVSAMLEPALAAAAVWLGRHGITLERRSAPSEAIGPEALERAAYEGGRPSAQEACRIGDERFLADWGR